MPEFFVSCAPGFEDELAEELHEFWPYLIREDSRPNCFPLIIKKGELGGVSLEAPEILGFQINLFSKLSHRVLLRVKKFSVRDANRLYHQLRDVELGKYFGNKRFDLEVACSRSRLNDERAVRDIAGKAWVAANTSSKAEKSLLTAYIRIHNDECLVSVDTSGEHLHKRGERLKQGRAPLRETLGAFCLRRLCRNSSNAERKKIALVDPMAGSGTFLLEAASMYLPNLGRSFAFHQFKSVPKILLSPSLVDNYPKFAQDNFAQLIGKDISAEMCKIMKFNLQDVACKIECTDLLTFPKSQNASIQPCWVICNPPYGERIQGPELSEVLASIEENYQPQRMGLLLPRSFKVPAQLASLRLVEKLPLRNGGIDINWVLFSAENHKSGHLVQTPDEYN